MSHRSSRSLWLGLLLGIAACAAPVTETPKRSLDAWRTVTVGVANLDNALQLWVDTFGFDILARSAGPDEELARLWGISPEDISRQALLHTRGQHAGLVHLVEFNDPGPPVRKDAQVFDLVPKNLDIYVDDLPRRFAELNAAGRTFRTESFSEVTAPDGTVFREIHMPSHDAINIVLLEVIGKQRPFTEKGFGGVGPLIYIVPDAPTEKAFVADVLGLDKLNDNLLKGPEIERMIGLPPGAGLDVSIWGRLTNDFGDIEIIEYQGVRGRNLYPAAVPKSLGVLHISYVTGDASALLDRAATAGTVVTPHGQVSTMAASGFAYSFATPAGLRIYLYEDAKTTH
ncbi:MAG: hypothetical protein QNJ14_02490 [Woeseiaceae bacterium]|nr:hypothetical protein [Woeseiaceae bacterium]